jgi:hypothetical protein
MVARKGEKGWGDWNVEVVERNMGEGIGDKGMIQIQKESGREW